MGNCRPCTQRRSPAICRSGAPNGSSKCCIHPRLLKECHSLRSALRTCTHHCPSHALSLWHAHRYTREFLRYTAVERYYNNAATQVYLSHQRKSGWLPSANPNASPSLCKPPSTPLSRSPMPFVERIWTKNTPN